MAGDRLTRREYVPEKKPAEADYTGSSPAAGSSAANGRSLPHNAYNFDILNYK